MALVGAGPAARLSVPSPQNASLRDWYTASIDAVTTSVAEEAFKEATTLFSTELTNDECKRVWLQEKNSIKDIEEIVLAAKKKYDDATGKRKVQKWLKKLLDRIVYYGAVLDTLAQHHPEYVALAWGALKFVFVGILNHEELLARVSEALSQIADVLPYAELSFHLYPTKRMKQIASQLYAYIIKFFQHAIIWYKKSALSKAISSIMKPYELHFKDTVAKIEYYARTVENSSTSASRAEIRDMHIKIDFITKKLNEIMQVSSTTQSLNKAISLDVREQKQMIYDLQLSRILSMIRIKGHPDDTLWLCQTVFNRRRRTQVDIAEYSSHLYQGLKLWAFTDNSFLFLVRSGPRGKPKAQGLAATTIEALLKHGKLVLWSLSTGDAMEEKPSATNILKALVFQALQLSVTGRYKAPCSLGVASFQAAHTEREWLDLLRLILSCNPETFIVIEAEDLACSVWKNQALTEEFLKLFRQITEGNDAAATVKVLVICYNQTLSPPATYHDSHYVLAPLDPPRAARRRTRARTRLSIQDVLQPLSQQPSQ